MFALAFAVVLVSFKEKPPVSDCDAVPALNQEIVSYVKTTIGKKVGRGECWDLAQEALNKVNAKWDGGYGFGRKVNPKNECVFPGDIIQFSNVTVTYQKDRSYFMEKMEKHTAIIYEVRSPEDLVLADQNTGMSGRKVGVHDLGIKNITTGTYTIFRPER